MDTISRENNNSYLWPVAAVLVGVIAVILAAVALFKANGASKAIAAANDQFATRIDTIESTANSASSTAQTALKNITSLQSQAQDGFNQIGGTLNAVQESIKKLQDAMTKPAPKAARVSKSVQAGEVSAPGTVSSDGTYTIKSGDSLAKIARANGISLADLKAANPEVDPKRLKVGQKINLPTKSQ